MTQGVVRNDSVLGLNLDVLTPIFEFCIRRVHAPKDVTEYYELFSYDCCHTNGYLPVSAKYGIQALEQAADLVLPILHSHLQSLYLLIH